MLDKLFNSPQKVKLLQYYLNNPQDIFTIGEISKKVRLNTAKTRMISNQLMVLGLLKEVSIVREDRKKKLKTVKGYKINTEFVLYSEIRALFLKSQLLLEGDLIRRIKKIGGAALIILTGVFCGLENGPMADLLIIGKVNRGKLARIIKKFEKRVNFEINYTVMSRAEYRYRKDITDRFLYSILENKKIVVLDKMSSGI